MNEIPKQHYDWLKSFYSAPGNDASIGDINKEHFPEEAKVIIHAMLCALDINKERGCVIVLPVVRQNKVTGWFATIQNNNLEVDLVNTIQSWLGPSYNQVFEFVTRDLSDNRVVALRSEFKGPILRFYGKEKAKITSKLLMYYSLIAKRPNLSKNRKRTVREIRADLEKALMIGDVRACSSLKSELFAAGRLNEQNKKFVEIQINAGLGEWKAIALNKPNISTLADLYLPNSVISDLLEALFRTFIEDIKFESFAHLLNTAKKEIVSKYPGLFQNIQVTPNWRVNLVYLLQQILVKSKDEKFIGQLKKEMGDKFRYEWTSEYQAFISEISTSSNLASDGAILGNEEPKEFDHIKLFQNLLGQEKTLRNVMNILYCYPMLDSDNLVKDFIGYVDEISEELIEKLPVGAQKTIRSSIETHKAREKSNGWMEWIRLASKSTDNSDITDLIQDNYKNWQVRDLLEDDQKFSSFIAACEELLQNNTEIFQLHVAKISECFLEDLQISAQKQINVAKTLLMCLALVEQKSKLDLEVISSITFIALSLNPNRSDYKDMLEILEEQRCSSVSYATLDWQLEICEFLATNRVPSDDCHNLRQQYFLNTCNDLQRFAHRLTTMQLRFLDFLSNDYDFRPEFVSEKLQEATSEEATIDANLNGKVVAIYTLTESAGRRAKRFIEEMYPGVTVKLSTDKVCSERLKGLSKSADIFLFTSKSSSHQAFYCIKDHSTTEPVQVSGKGTSSILNALQAHL